MTDSSSEEDWSTTSTILADSSGALLAIDPLTRRWLLALGKDWNSDARPSIGDLVPALKADAWRVAVADEAGDLVIRARLAVELSASADRDGEVSLRIRRLDGASEELFVVEIDRSLHNQDAVLRRDPVTGLCDRDALGASFAAWQSAGGPGLRTAARAVDLDGFKQVNDNYGHAVGDRVLAELARRWLACVRDSDVICRYGGDEFVALFRGVDSLEAAEPVVGRLQAATADPLEIDGRTLNLGVSIGVAISGEEIVSLDDLIAEADRRMYAAKRGQRS